VLDRNRKELSRESDELQLKLQPLLLTLLEHFLANPGRVISKDELLKSVWKSPFVTDSAVVRAVMKLRRTVGSIISTVHGVGYRFDELVTEVEHADAASLMSAPQRAEVPSGPRAVLRFVDHRLDIEDANLNEGLACWLQYVCEQSGLGPLLPMSSVLAWSPMGDQALDVRAACTALGAAQAISCRVSGDASRIIIDASWGSANGQVQNEHIFCDSVPAALLMLVRALGGKVPVAIEDSDWSEQLVKAFMLERQGRAAEALALLESQPEEALLTGPLLLMRVRLMRMQGRAVDAERTALAALDSTRVTLQSIDRVRLLTELVANGALQSHYAEAKSWWEQAMALIEADATSTPALAEALLVMTQVTLERGDHAESIQLCNRALEAAIAEGDSVCIIRARLRLAIVLNAGSRPSEALHQAHLGSHAAAVSDLPRLQGHGYTILGTIHARRMEHTSALEFSRKAVAFSEAGGDRLMAFDARLLEFGEMVWANRLEEASFALTALERAAVVGPGSRRRMNAYGSWLLWRQGQLDEAVAALRAVFQEFVDVGSGYQWDVGAQLFHWHLSLRQRGAAQQLLDRLADDPNGGRRGLQLASLALYDGDRERCVGLLRRVWSRHAGQGPYLIDCALNLAWLLLEDGQMAGQASLWRQVEAITPQHDSARLVKHVYRVATGKSVSDPEAWRREVISIPGLAQRHRWLADPVHMFAPSKHVARKLPELLSQACW